MRFHSMYRGGNFTIDYLKNEASFLDSFGYYSILLTYHSNCNDSLIKSILVADNAINLKFMIAIRTYAISPEYLSMIYNSYNEEFPNKLIFNIVSGDIHSDESSIENIVMISNDLSNPENRLVYTKEWLEKFIKISSKKSIPEIFVAGHSDETIKISNELDLINISMLDMYKKRNSIDAKKQLIALSIIIRDTEKEAIDFLDKNNMSREKQWTLFGTKESIKKQLLEMKKNNINDILVVINKEDDQFLRVHEMIKEIIKNDQI